MTDRLHIADQGDSIETLAHRAGLLAETILDHPQNAGLRQGSRTRHILLRGDEVLLPARTERVEPCADRTRHRFVVTRRLLRVHVRFMLDSVPRANAAYTIALDAQPAIAGVTDGAGYIDHQVSPATCVARVHFDGDPAELVSELLLGHLDPIVSPSGVRQRLQNLEFCSAATAEDWDEDTVRALAGFQSAHGLDPTGTLDSATQAALLDAHGS